MKGENASAAIVGITSIIALAAVLLCSGCATPFKYGDGRVGTTSLDPMVGAIADAADAKVPGSGDRIRAYYSDSKASRVPVGYMIVTDSFLDGKIIDETKIVRVPKLAPLNPDSPAIVVTTNGNPFEGLPK